MQPHAGHPSTVPWVLGKLGHGMTLEWGCHSECVP